jgi:hypothetical protein
MRKLVALVADVLLATLLGVLMLPVSSNSTVKGKTWEVPVMVCVMLAEERVSVEAPVVVKDGEQLVPIPVRPAGMDDAPVFTHHS